MGRAARRHQRNSLFQANDAARGGAIFNEPTVDIDGNIFIGNKADWGGAIHNDGEDITLHDSYFYGNRALVGGGAMLGNDDSVLRVTNSSFSENSAAGIRWRTAGPHMPQAA